MQNMNDMNERPLCHRAEDLVTYLYGEANEAEAKDFAGHMQLCNACRSEFAIFEQVHESILEWRSEALGAVSLVHASQAAAQPNSEPATLPSRGRRPSGLAAVREFFNVSPLWLRGATAFASVLFCVLVALAVAQFWQKPAPVASAPKPDKVYTQEQFNAELTQQVDRRVKELRNAEAGRPQSANAAANPATRKLVPRHNSAGGSQLARLTRQEREQLAADLRLTPGSDDDDLSFVLPNEPNLPNELNR